MFSPKKRLLKIKNDGLRLTPIFCKERIGMLLRHCKECIYAFPTCAIIFLFSILPISALDTIDINTCNPNCVIGKNLEILEDKTNTLTINDIRDPRRDKACLVPADTTTEPCWKKSESDKPNFGISASAYWVRFKVANNTDKPVRYFLELYYPQLDYAHFYYYQNGHIKEIVLGDRISFYKRTLPNRNPLFEIKMKAQKEGVYFMKFTSQGTVTFPLSLWEPKAFYDYDHNMQMYYGFYFGILFVMAMYNLFLYFSIHDKVYLFYVFYLVGISSVASLQAGFAYEYLFPDSPSFINIYFFISIAEAGFGIILFTRSFLNTKIQLPKVDWILKVYFILFIVLFIGGVFLPYHSVIPFSALLMIITPTTCFIIAFILLRKGYRPARLYFLAWSLLIISTIMFAFRGIGLLPTHFIIVHGFEVGSVIEVILLSLALADRINILKKEKEESQKALIAKQEEAIAIQKELISSYARFVPEQLLTFLGKDIITKVGLGDSVQKDMTILFSDIRAFTSISESLSPSENFGFINSYLETMGPIIRKHNGFIDKYIGDAIMALFPQKPSDAIDASIEMLEELHKLNVKRKAKGYSPISIGIGIHTGSQMLGIIGEKERMEGTVISDVVNTASRLEGLTKAYSTALLVSEDVLDGVADKDKYEFRFLDTVKVKGKNKAVRIFEILNGVSPRIRELKLQTKPDFEAGINFYYSKNFKDSIKKMKSVLKKDSKDKAAELYIERCNFYSKNGVDPNWDGIEKLDFK
ncbi:MAG TPA: 7TM diverse intracellular signaling domain-containing protein [Leptospiraceae bacterium]|nr:7TM diverse intracellular signaling domain-containing protein [Leptospiraceae bacterium]